MPPIPSASPRALLCGWLQMRAAVRLAERVQFLRGSVRGSFSASVFTPFPLGTNVRATEAHLQSLSSFPLAISGILGGPSWPALGPQGPLRLVPNEADWSPAQGGSFKETTPRNYRGASTMTGESPSLEGIYHGSRRHIVYIYTYIYTSNSVAEDD